MRASPRKERRGRRVSTEPRSGEERQQESGEGSTLVIDRDQFEGSRCLMRDKRGE